MLFRWTQTMIEWNYLLKVAKASPNLLNKNHYNRLIFRLILNDHLLSKDNKITITNPSIKIKGKEEIKEWKKYYKWSVMMLNYLTIFKKLIIKKQRYNMTKWMIPPIWNQIKKVIRKNKRDISLKVDERKAHTVRLTKILMMNIIS